MKIGEKIRKKLNHRISEGNIRTLPDPNSNLIDFFSNDYLGFAKSEELLKLIQQQKVNTSGSTGSRLLSGNSAKILSLENKLAQFFESESSLLLNSGYLANLALLSCIAGKDDLVFYDELSHASIKDGIRLGLAKKVSFKHNNLDDLRSKLERSKSESKFIVVESVYSMDGDYVFLEDLISLAGELGAEVIIDEAHALGVIGKEGKGLSISVNLQDKLFARIYTFGKALGVHGACICGSEKLKNYLINFSRPFIYSTALPEHNVVSIQQAISYLETNVRLCEDLNQNISTFKSLISSKVNLISSDSAIQAIIIPGNNEVKKASKILQENGFDVRAILSPTVREGQERLRICLHAYNSEKEISQLVSLINRI